jgi:hypothetical protein
VGSGAVVNSSEHLNEIAPSLVAALGKMRNPKPDSKATVQTRSGGSYSYDYLSLPSLLEAVRKVFSEHGLALVQEVVGTQRGIGVVTRIIHSISGQYIETGPLELPAGTAPQEHGSAITYARRYSLAAAVGLAADEDDDASKVQPQRSRSATPLRAEGPGTVPENPGPNLGPEQSGGTSSAPAQESGPEGGVSGKGAPSGSDNGDYGHAHTPSEPSAPPTREQLEEAVSVFGSKAGVMRAYKEKYRPFGIWGIQDISGDELDALIRETAK